MIFIDASALVAIFLNEDDADALEQRIYSADHAIVSPLVVWECVAALVRQTGATTDSVTSRVMDYLDTAGVRATEIGPAELDSALKAFATFGKGRHPARLNLGDCFAYACAKANGAKLLFKGDDFALTDIDRA